MSFTPKQQQDYYYEKSKPGSTVFDKKTGKLKLVSDFMRGVYYERGKTIYKARVKCAKRHEAKNKQSKNKKIQRPVPKWYESYKKESELSKKQKQSTNESNESLEELKAFFTKK